MSRIGNKPIEVPSGVEVSISPSQVTIKGKVGTLTQDLPSGITVAQEENRLLVSRASNSKRQRAFHGLIRSLIENHVVGVANGYTKTLEIHGVSYQASVTPQQLTLKVGYANEIKLKIPQGVNVECPNNTLVVVSGADKQRVGQFAAEVRAARPPEPYKAKGIRYRGEHIVRKQGKSFVGSE